MSEYTCVHLQRLVQSLLRCQKVDKPTHIWYSTCQKTRSSTDFDSGPLGTQVDYNQTFCVCESGWTASQASTQNTVLSIHQSRSTPSLPLAASGYTKSLAPLSRHDHLSLTSFSNQNIRNYHRLDAAKLVVCHY